MEWFILGCGLPVVTGIAALLLGRSRMASWIAALGVWAGSAVALVPVVTALSGRDLEPLQMAWSMPGGSLSFGLDGLSAFFCLPILLVAPLAALYGCAYLAREKRPLGTICFFSNVLAASMLLLMAARNGLLFLIVWELMAISSFFLVVFDDEHLHVRQAGWTYLIATHIGTAALLAMFALLGRQTDSLDFDTMAAAGLSPAMASILFALAVIGFGSKAGFIPLHVWLPEAHPAAPSHVSALMSGVMIKTGIYGLLRVLTLLGDPLPAWGWTLVIVGIVFLGEPRSSHAQHAAEVGAAMRWPMATLAGVCLAIGLLASAAVKLVLPAVHIMTGNEVITEPVTTATRSLTSVAYVSVSLLVLVVVLFLLRRYLPRGREETAAGTWDCGYARPTTRMQYTASSFAQPLTNLFRMVLGTQRRGAGVQGFFPKPATFETHTPDAARERLFAPLFGFIDRSLSPIRRMQHGRIHEYLLYIAIVLVLLLIWKAGGRP